MLVLPPDDVVTRPDLVKFAATDARGLFAAHCAECHGADMKGDVRTGAPNLTDAVWLYGNGDVLDIERTILYGIRAPRGNTRNVTEMPALGLNGELTKTEISNVVQYVLMLSRRPNLTQAALAGKEIFNGKGNCSDCHSPDGEGNPDYGAPSLTANVWNNGGDPASLYKSIYFGIAHVMPAWYGVLPLGKIRALAVYIYSVSHTAAPPRPAYPPPSS
jgi:cytochrome c oxidase cbb3-type subunit 3